MSPSGTSGACATATRLAGVSAGAAVALALLEDFRREEIIHLALVEVGEGGMTPLCASLPTEWARAEEPKPRRDLVGTEVTRGVSL